MPGSVPAEASRARERQGLRDGLLAAKLLLDEAMEQRVGSKKTIKLLGFTCRYKPETEASGVVSCTGHGASARAAFSVF